MKLEIFARSPGLVLGAVASIGRNADLSKVDFSREEQAQRIAKLSTGSPSLVYEIEILEAIDDRPSDARFGLHTDGGLVIRDGYQFTAEDAARHEAIVALADAYYSVDVFLGGEQDYGRMRLALLFRPSTTRIEACGAVVDYIVPS